MAKQTFPKLPAKFKSKWCAALRSGKYKQGMGQLKYRNPETKEFEHCCLGVACEVGGAKVIRGDVIIGKRLKTFVPKILHFEAAKNPLIDKLTRMNDFKGKSFKQIANWIEKNL